MVWKKLLKIYGFLNLIPSAIDQTGIFNYFYENETGCFQPVSFWLLFIYIQMSDLPIICIISFLEVNL